MSNDSQLPLQAVLSPAILSPCVGICRLDPHGYCLGCYRTGDEIARWRSMSETERSHYMDVVLPARESA